MSNAAGENDYEVDRVKCFEASCVALGPLIFDLKESAGYKELHKALAETAKLLSVDAKIKDKVVYTSFKL